MDRSVIKVEVAGNYEAPGYILGRLYREQGQFPQAFKANESMKAQALLDFYQDVAPGFAERLHGVYAAYKFSLDDLNELRASVLRRMN